MFGLEVSRLARSNADLARLLELARLTGTLVIDNDGIYDLSLQPDFVTWWCRGCWTRDGHRLMIMVCEDT